MFIINIILSTQQHGYIYEHGAELFGAIITALAFIYTFRRIYKENEKENETENEKNQKTLIMIDLISGKHIDNIEHIKNQLNDVKVGTTLQIGLNGVKPAYQIDLNDIDSHNIMHTKKVYYTRSFDKYHILESFKRIKENNTTQIIKEYKDEITKILSNQHLNLNLNSLDKINNKINNLSELLQKLKALDRFIELVEHSADVEMNDPRVIKSEKANENKSNDFLKDRIKDKIEELDSIMECLEKIQKKLE
ncbi:hypothetical protein [Mammaliicoccus sp. N-M50]|uniref:hypothetical protein n=1 Tax=Mammaliicoccus sp. N-M50 TaxID=2898709 RepID=UPI001EFC0205|nr:hypothetical protein [Mammaliicoccus sp. N-M50]